MTKDQDRRSRSPWNRFYRLVSRRGWTVGSVIFLTVGIALIVVALEGHGSSQPQEQTAAQIAGQTRDDLRLVYVVAGAVVALFGIIAGVAKLAEPVARKVVSDHSRDPQAHGGLTAIGELKRQAEESARRHAHLGSQISVLSTQIRLGFDGLPCRHDRPQSLGLPGCPASPGDEDGEV